MKSVQSTSKRCARDVSPSPAWRQLANAAHISSMDRIVMHRRTLYVCEIPWAQRDSYSELSMHPFLSGLSELHGPRLLYRTFTTSDELGTLLSEQMPAPHGNRIIVYVSAHGSNGCLWPEFGSSIKLKPVAEKMARYAECVWLGACRIGKSDALAEFVRNGGASWAGGYTCYVDWRAAFLIDLAILQAALTHPLADTKEAVVSVFRSALGAFNPEWMIDSEERVTLRDGFRIVGRNLTQGPTSEDLTVRVREALGWV